MIEMSPMEVDATLKAIHYDADWDRPRGKAGCALGPAIAAVGVEALLKATALGLVTILPVKGIKKHRLFLTDEGMKQIRVLLNLP